MEGSERSLHCQHRGPERHDGHRGERRPGPGDGGLIRHASRLGRDDVLVPGKVSQRSLLTKSSDGHVDQVGIDKTERLVGEIEAVDRRPPQVLDEHVRIPHQVAQPVTSRRRDEISFDCRLPPVPDHEASLTPGAPTSRRLHLDHAGTVVGHHHAGHLAGHGVRHLDYPNPIQCACHEGSPPTRPTARGSRSQAPDRAGQPAPIQGLPSSRGPRRGARRETGALPPLGLGRLAWS